MLIPKLYVKPERNCGTEVVYRGSTLSFNEKLIHTFKMQNIYRYTFYVVTEYLLCVPILR